MFSLNEPVAAVDSTAGLSWPAIARQPSSRHGRFIGDAPLRQLKPQEHLFFEGEEDRHVYLIQSGIVRLYKVLQDGRRQILSFRFAGDLIGLDLLTQDFCSAEAATGVSVQCLSSETARQRMCDEPQTSRAFIELLSAELAELRSQIAILNGRSAIEKLAALLRDLWRRADRQRGHLQLELSRLDMADFLGLTIETVSRNLTKLRKRRIIDLPQTHTLVILDMERLERLAAGDRVGW